MLKFKSFLVCPLAYQIKKKFILRNEEASSPISYRIWAAVNVFIYGNEFLLYNWLSFNEALQPQNTRKDDLY